jgi:pimeloyl-ACP methyl ester carboxylesterase
LTLAVFIFTPAPPGGAQFQLSSNDPSVAAAGDPRQGFLPVVTIPAGGNVSNVFQIFGIRVGSTQLKITPLTPGFGTSLTPLGTWDVNQPGDQKFVDANPPTNHCRASDSSNDLSTDPNVLATCGSTVKGVGSDGVSQLLLRTVSGLSGTACYQITSSSNFEQGSIQDAVLSTQSVGALQYGFTFYTPPDFFGDTADSRTLQVQFAFTPSIGNGNTTVLQAQTLIIRPPVVLIHGLWSDAGAWSSDFKKENAFRTTYTADYNGTSGSRFSVNAPRIQDFVSRGLQNARAKGYAVTQVDVAGHSMGGILSRLYIGSSQFLRPNNFGSGDIRRLITLDTPHLGSSFANLIVSLHAVNPTDTERTVTDLTGGRAGDGAVCDLAENSTGLQGLNSATDISVQVITATGGPAGTATSPAPYWGGVLGGLVKNFEAALTKQRCVKRDRLFRCTQQQFIFPQNIVNAFRFRQQNDAIVALSGQQGGLASFNFPTLLHFGGSFAGITVVNGVTNTPAVATQVYQLLDGSTSNMLGGFPGVGSTGTGVPSTVPGRGATQDAQDYSSQCGTGGPLHGAAIIQGEVKATSGPSGFSATDSRVHITSPANGEIFAPGATVPITVALTPPLSANDIAVDIPNVGRLDGTNFNGTTYQASFLIPTDFAGALTLIPNITDTNNVPIQGVPVTIAVRPTTTASSITLTQHNFRITLPTANPSESLSLFGTYPNNVIVDFTSSAAGTTYQSTNTNVVQVNSEGIYQIMGPGTAVITAANAGLKDFAIFVVEDPANPLAPQDITLQVAVQLGGIRLDRTTGFFVQDVTVTNSSPTPFPGPLYFIVSGLTSGVSLVNESGITQNIQPGSPFMTLPLATDGLTLLPGQSVNLTLQFLDPNHTSIHYSSSVVQAFHVP